MENLKRYIVGLNLSGNIERGLLKVVDESVDVYSLTETLTNKVYLGEPVYRRVIPHTDFNENEDGVLEYDYTQIKNINKIVDLKIEGTNGDGAKITELSAEETQDGFKMPVLLRNDDNFIDINADISEANVIIEYTKIN